MYRVLLVSRQTAPSSSRNVVRVLRRVSLRLPKYNIISAWAFTTSIDTSF